MLSLNLKFANPHTVTTPAFLNCQPASISAHPPHPPHRITGLLTLCYVVDFCFYSHVTFCFHQLYLHFEKVLGKVRSETSGDSCLWNKAEMVWRLREVHFLSSERNPHKTLRSWVFLQATVHSMPSVSSEDRAGEATSPAPRVCLSPGDRVRARRGHGQSSKGDLF